MAKHSGNNSTGTLFGESLEVAGLGFLDAALTALKGANSEAAEHLLARLEALGVSGLTPDELGAVQALMAQSRAQNLRFAQADTGTQTDAQPEGAPQAQQDAPAAGNGNPEPTPPSDAGAGNATPAPADTAPQGGGQPGGFGPGGVGGPGTGFGLGAGGSGPAAPGSFFGAAPTGAGAGGFAPGAGAGGVGPGAASGGGGVSADFSGLASSLSSISLNSFNNFSFGTNGTTGGTTASSTGTGFATSSSLGGNTILSDSSTLVPFVQQSIGVNGALAAQPTLPTSVTPSGSSGSSNSSTTTVGGGSITVSTTSAKSETPTTPPPAPVVPPPENPNGTVSVRATAAAVSEGTAETPTVLTFTVTRTNALRADEVPYTLSGIDGLDLVGGAGALRGKVSFAAGETTATITVQVVADHIVEASERLAVTLARGTYATPTGGAATTTLTNDDFASLTIAAESAVVLEGDPDDEGGEYQTLSYTITRTAPEGTTALPADTISWQIDGTASGAVDIGRIPLADRGGSITFAAGQTEAVVTVRVAKNYEVDTNENVVVKVLDSTLGRADADLGHASTEVTDDDPTIHFQAQQISGVEGTNLVFTLARSSGVNSSLDVTWSMLSVNGLSEGLLRQLGLTELPTGTVHFAAGQTQAQIVVETTHDELVGEDAKFTLAITSVSDGEGVIAPTHVRASTLEGTILNKDALISAEVVDIADNPTTNVSTYTIRVSRSEALAFSHTLNYTLAGSGENPLDVSVLDSTSGTITFAPGVEYVDILVPVDKDEVPRGLSSFVMNLTGSDVVFVNDAVTANVAVEEVGVAVFATAAKLIEGTGAGDTHAHTFEIRLDQPAVADVVVHWTVSAYTNANSALNANAADFGGTFPSGTVTIPAGQTTATVTVTPSADGSIEETERYYLNIDVTDGPGRVTLNQAVGQILNDDSRFGFASATVAGNEGHTGDNGVLEVQVVRQGYTRSTVSASWHVELLTDEARAADFAGGQDGLGTNGGLPSGRIELIPGEVAGTIAIEFAGNTTLEPDKDFRIVLDDPGFGTELGLATTTATITNDDAILSVVNATMTVDEGNAGQSNLIRIALHREGDLRGTDTVTWQALVSGDHPASSGDIRSTTASGNVLATGTVTFQDGSDTAYITVPLVSDDVAELDETLQFQLVSASPGNVIDQAHHETLVTIRNDDDVVSLQTVSAQGTEDTRSGTTASDGSIQFTLTRTGDITKATTVTWTIDTSGGTASANDFVATTGTVTFAAGSSSATIVVHPSVDITYEADETFTLRLDTPASGSGTRLGAQSSAAGTIVNDDVKVVVDHIERAPSEGDSGTVAHTIYLTRVGDLSQGSTVNWSVAGSQLVYNNQVLAEALSGIEFSGTTSGTVTWSASDAAVKAITVYTTGDTDIEGDEAFRLNLTAGINDRSDLQANGTYVLVADDDASIGIVRAGEATVTEGRDGTTLTIPFTVTRTGDTTATATVDWTATGASGIVVDHGTVTFNPDTSQVTITYNDGRPSQVVNVGAGEQSITLNVQVAGDDVVESGEALTVTLSNPHVTASTDGASAHVSLDSSATAATVTITNDDDKLVVSGNASITEGNTTNPTYTFTITRTGDTTKETNLQWRLTGTGEVQVNEDDFVDGQEDSSVPNDGLPSGRITFAAGQTSAQVSVQVHSDVVIEATEGFKLDLDVPAGNTEINDSLTVALVADDNGYNVTARKATVTEGNDATVTDHTMIFDLVRAGDTSQAETVTWTVTGLTAGDVLNGTALTGTVTFAAGETGKSIALPIQEDSVKEADKIATLTLKNQSNQTLASGSITLKDDDAAVSVNADQASVAEGTPIDSQDPGYTEVTFTVHRQGNLLQQSTVDWTVAGGVNGADFVGGVLPSGTVTFASGDLEQTVTVYVRRDSVKEGNEALQLVLDNASSGTQVSGATATTTITNDDALVEFSASTVTHAEGDSGTTAYTFTLTRSGYTSQTSTVQWSIGYEGASRNDISSVNADGTSVSTSNLTGTVTFASGETSKTITVYVNGDSGPQVPNGWPYSTVGTALEGDETFKVQISPVSTGTETGSAAAGVITNDDVRIQLTDVHTNLREGAAVDEQTGQPEVIPQWITLERQGDPSKAVSIYWYAGNTNFTNNVNLDEADAAFGHQIASVSSESSGVTLFDLDEDGVAECGIITWAANDVAAKTLQFVPTADDLASGDWNFTVYVKPVPATVDGQNHTAENASRTYIDEIGVTVGGGAVSRYDFASTSGIALTTMTVKRDESGIWVSNQVISDYNEDNSSPSNGQQQYSGYDWPVFAATTPWDGVRFNGDVSYSGLATPEGTARPATAGQDYTSTDTTLHFTEDNRVQHVTVSLTDDAVREGFESFSLFLNDGDGYSLSSDHAVAEIADDEVSAAQRVHVSGSTAIEGMDQYVTFKVTFGQPLAQDTNLSLELNANGTDQADPDTDLGSGQHLYFRYVTSSADGNAVDDHATAVLQFQNYWGGYSMDTWFDFGDLAAGQTDLHVGGYANPSALASNSAEGMSEQGVSYDIWIPVKAGAEIDTNALTLHFTGVEGELSGSFVGIADLSDNNGLNADAIAFMEGYSSAGWVSSGADIQNYFHSEGAGDVKFLKFTVTQDWDSVEHGPSPNLVWSVDGLDVSDVVAPQWDNVFSDFRLVQDLTVPAGQQTTYFDVQLADDAQYYEYNRLGDDGLLPNSDASAPSVSVEEYSADGVREVWMTITRADASQSDVVPYEWNYDWVWNEDSEEWVDPLLSGSSDTDGLLQFAAGETSKTVVFRLDETLGSELSYSDSLDFDAQYVAVDDFGPSTGPISSMITGAFEYSVDGGETWLTQDPALNYTYRYEGENHSGVDDRSTLVFEFNNDEGYSLNDWMDFTDLAAGQTDLHVGGWANSGSLYSNWSNSEGAGGVSFDIWIPVKGGSVAEDANLQIQFVGEGSMTGSFAGIADLESDGGLNDQAVTFMEGHSSAWWSSDAADVQDYFSGEGAGNVDLLKFTVSMSWDEYYSLSGVWRIDGLDVHNVVAPQWDNTFGDLLLVKDAVVADGSAGGNDTIALADDASFLRDNADALDDDGVYATQGSLTSALTSDEVESGIRELHFTVTRTDTDAADAVPYYVWIGGSLASGSDASYGTLTFDAGQSQKELVFRFNDGTSYNTSLEFDQWDLVDDFYGNGLSGADGLQLAAGTEEVLIRYQVRDDSIDEATEKLTLTATLDDPDAVVNQATGTAAIVDNDAPVLTHASVNNAYFADQNDNFRVEVFDVNARNGGTPSLSSMNNVVGSSQEFTITLTLSGAWEVALVQNGQLDDGQANGNDWVQHYSGLPWTVVPSGAAEEGGSYTYELTVPAGTSRICVRSVDDDHLNTFDAEVTHVDPVIVARDVVVDEDAGTVSFEVVAVGGDLGDDGVDVDVSTEDGTWVDYTFVFSREFAATGEQRATWVVESVTNSDMPDGNGYADYVNGYFGFSSLGTVSPDDFLIVGDQTADPLTGLPSGTVVFADGQKEATVTVRVRADAIGEPDEEFRVRLVDALDGAQKLANPQASLTYAQLYEDSGYARITNDDPVFRIDGGKVLNEAHGEVGVTATAPEGYTLHTFTIVRDGDATAAATVDWVLQVSSGSGLTTGGVIGSVSDTNMLAKTDDFGGEDAGIYAMAWQAVGENGLVQSLAQTVTFAAGETSKVVTFAVKDDTDVELAEVFRVLLTNPQPLPGNETLPGVSDTRGFVDFLIGDNDGETVSVAISTQVYNTGSSQYVVNDPHTVIDAATGLPMVEEGTSLANKNQIVLTFTRSGDTSQETQAYYEMQATGNDASAGITATSGDAHSDGSMWYGVVTFAAGSSTAKVVFNIASDNYVEADTRVKVTLYDYEHLPESWRGPSSGFTGGADGPTIGTSSTLPDWDTTIRDPDAYTAEAVIKNDDVRLWLNGFTDTRWADSGYYTTPAATVPGGGAVYEGGEASGAGNDLTFTFSRAGRQDNDIVLNWTIVNGTTNASDFMATSGTLTLPGSSSTVQANSYTTQTITLADFFKADYNAEENENFQIVFTSTDNANVKFTYDFINEGNTDWGTGGGVSRAGTGSMAVGVTVLNDDVVYSIDNTANQVGGMAKVTEGAAGSSADFTFNVHRVVDSADGDVRGGYESSSTVYWRVVTTGSSHPVDASDFVLLSGQSLGDNGLPMGSVTFAGGYDTIDPEVLKQITLRVRGDNAVEFGEGFTIELYNPSIGHVDQANGSVDAVIVNDDTGIAINDVTVVEGNTNGGTTVQFTVTRSGMLNVATSADWTKVDVTTDEVDFTGAVAGSVSFASTGSGMVDGYGEETRTVTLTVNGDTIPEDDQAFNVQLGKFVGVSDVVDRTGTATLKNDDSTFSVAVTEGQSNSHVEGDGEGYSFTITRTNDTAQAQTVAWAVVGAGGRNVVDGTDFGGSLASGSVTFQPGELSKTITFAGSSADITSEGDERFSVHLTLGAGGGSSTIETNDAVGIVVNDDPGIFINDGKSIIQREGSGGTASYEFDVTAVGLTGSTSVDWQIVLDDTASAADFTGPLSGTLTFTGNGTQTVSVGLVTDSVLESSENFHIHLSNNANIIQSTNDALGTIGDDDYALAIGAAQAAEGDGRKSMQFVFTRTGSSALPVEVNWSVAAGTADASDFPGGALPFGTFTIPAGSSSYTLSVPIQGDVVLEGNETFTLNATYDGVDISGVGTITNDDEEFAVAPITAVAEGSAGSPGTVQFTVTRAGNLSGTSSVVWTIAGSGDHPAANGDFSALTGTVEFADGQASKVVSVPLVGNGTAEFDKGYTVTLSDPGVASSVSATNASASGTILNDDLGFVVSADHATVTEGDSGTAAVTWTITRSGGDLGQTVTVDWTLGGLNATNATNAADFSGLVTSGTATFGPNQTTATVTVNVVGDSYAETAQAPLTLTLSNPSASGTLLTPSAVVTLADDDDKFSLVALDGDQLEGNSGTVTYTYRVTREGVPSGSSTVDWSVAGSGGHALSADEFVGATSGTLTFADGETEKIISVQVASERVGEYDESFTISLGNPGTGSEVGSPSSAVTTVINDDPVLFLSMANTQVIEGDEGDDHAFTFTIRRSGDVSGTASVAWAIAGGDGNPVNADDFGGLLPSGVVVFTAGQTERTVTVLTAGDNSYEPTETFNVVLSNAVNATILEGEVHNAQLVNDDTRITLSVDHAAQAEGNAGDQTVYRFFLDAAGLADHVEIHWHLEGTGDHPLNAADYAAGVQTSGISTVHLSGGEGQETVDVTINGDNVKGYDETFRFVIDDIIGYDGNDHPVGAGTGGNDAVVATVLDDDSLISFQTSSVSVTEGDDGTVQMSYVVTRSGSALALGSAVTVDYAVRGGFADSAGASDFLNGVLPSGTVTFGANETQATIHINVAGDTLVEGNEMFTLALSNASNGASIAPGAGTAQGTILADDLGLQINTPMTVQSEDQARFSFDIMRSGPVNEAIDVTYQLGTPSQGVFDAQTGASANDFTTPTTGTIHFDAGQTQARFYVDVAHDTRPEASEQFSFQVNYGDVSAWTSCTIANDDAGTVTPPTDQLPAVADTHH